MWREIGGPNESTPVWMEPFYTYFEYITVGKLKSETKD